MITTPEDDELDDLQDDGRINYRKTPFPWFGGKSQAAPLVWQLLGDVPHYVEPFFGGGAVLLNRPHPCNRTYYSETVNDLDGLVVNAWRAMQYHPEETARHASWPVTELDKNARQIRVLQWRKDKDFEKLAGTHDYCDPLIAGWWLWGTCVQIGAFDGTGPWTADPVTGRIRKWKDIGGDGPGAFKTRPDLEPKGVARAQSREPGVLRNRPDIGGNGKGVNHAGAREPGVSRDLPHLGDDGKGVNHPQAREPGVSRDLPHLGDDGKGVNRPQARKPGVLSDDGDTEFHPITMPELIRWFRWLSARLRHVRVINGDWSRVCTSGAAETLPVRQGKGPVGVFLDPPYSSEANRSMALYAMESGTVAHDVRAWCVERGSNPKYRIVLAGFDNEHTELERHGWTAHEWFAGGFLRGGMGNVSKTGAKHQQKRERLWASPHCLLLESAKGNGQRSLLAEVLE
jgi:hypothetical protein